MKELEPQKTALVLGVFVGGLHLAWSILILLGFAQPLLNWILSLHSLNNPFVVQPFDGTRTILLVTITFVVGYLDGWIFAWLWNKLHA